MTSLGPTDALPGNLSAQQLFVLALLASKAHPERDRSVMVRYTWLSWTTAEEFDDNGTHIWERGYGRHGRKRTLLRSNHTSSFSRTVERLEERGYLERRASRPSPRGNDRTGYVAATEKGLRAGREAIQRHQDGRYSLSFETLDDFIS